MSSSESVQRSNLKPAESVAERSGPSRSTSKMFDIYLARSLVLSTAADREKYGRYLGCKTRGLCCLHSAGQTIVQYMVSPSLSISLFSLSMQAALDYEAVTVIAYNVR